MPKLVSPSFRAYNKWLEVTRVTQRRTSTTLTRSASASINNNTRKTVLSNGTRYQRAKTTTARKPHTHKSLRSMRTQTTQREKATLAGNSSSSASSSSSAATAAATNEGQRNLRKELIDVVSAILGKPRALPIPRWVTPKYYTMTYSECFGHASFILVAASYALDDFLWLRIIAVAGSTSMLVFTYFHPHGRVLWLPFKWNALFIAINSYRIGKVFWDRYMAEQLSEEMIHTRQR